MWQGGSPKEIDVSEPGEMVWPHWVGVMACHVAFLIFLFFIFTIFFFSPTNLRYSLPQILVS